MNFKQLSGLFLIVAIAFSSCMKTDSPVIAPVQTKPAVGAYVISEGGFTGNNTKLSYYTNSSATVVGDFFLQQNPALSVGLGGLGNDAIIYGSKLYIVMNGSGNVTVLNANDAVFIKKISFLINNLTNKQPRYAVGARGKVYVTAYDNTVTVIDTSSLTITKTINVGANPEGIAASANFLYVANSGGFNATPDSTVSLIDLTTETEIRKIKVGVNPYKVEINTAGNVFVSANGDYGAIPASISIINGAVNLTSVNLGSNFSYSNIRIAGDIAYLYGGSTGTAKVYNTATNTVVRNEFITDGTSVQTAYGVNVDEVSGDVYIADALNFVSSGKVTCFTSAGVKKFTFSVSPGVNPNKILFKR